MIAKAPQIGFDRFIQLDWVAAAVGVRAEKGSLEELTAAELVERHAYSVCPAREGGKVRFAEC